MHVHKDKHASMHVQTAGRRDEPPCAALAKTRDEGALLLRPPRDHPPKNHGCTQEVPQPHKYKEMPTYRKR